MRAGFAGVRMSVKMDAAREAYPKRPARRGGLRSAKIIRLSFFQLRTIVAQAVPVEKPSRISLASS